ncbi:MAG: DNA gyrase subunit A [Chloroflexi bacterium]|nr:DNA gyrase subunit A [Chloroflexota bacterium]MBP8056412.1 DNA gyrase subunit A [Chloroflexota bacterium]
MEVGLIRPIDIDHEMRESYLSYAMSVIVSRALPDARDGLKPVQRRILYAMYDMGLRPTLAYRKSARVVGEVLGKYHPHGDQSVYDAMVRMAQSFSLRYMLVEGQGNFGSIDGDAAAAMRYTEARMSHLGHALLDDIEKNTVNFGPNFDDSLKEPLVLPSTIPNLLVNGASGIAVGMATSIPPHNLGEVVDALAFMLDNWDKLDDVAVSDLLQFVKGPDFPTGGLIFRYRDTKTGETDAVANAYATGKGAITVRAKVHLEQIERNKTRIVITELPYQTNIANMMERIADLHRDGRIEGLTDLRDESDRNGMRIILETARGAKSEDILAQLFQLTPLQSTFSINLLALVNGEPRVLNLKQALRVYLDHRQEIVRRRSEYDLTKAQERAHILEGLLVALDNLDEIIDTIRRSQTAETAQTNLQKKFKLSEVQAKAVLDMPLRRLAGLERRKLRDEFEEKQKLIKYLQRILATPAEMRTVIKEDLLAIKKQYSDVRRTQIVDKEASQVITQADLLPDEQVWVMVGEKGTIARTTSPEPIKLPLKPEEMPLALLQASTQDVLYLFTVDGQSVSLPVYQLPKATELGQGTHYAELTGLRRKDLLAAAITLPSAAEGFLFLTTLAGVVKRIRLDDLPGITTTPFTVIRVEEGDSLGWARLTTGENELLLGTAAGQIIRFKEDEVRSMGLPAGGVAGIKLQDETDGVIGVELARPDSFVWSISDNGMAKATPINEYPAQGRNGQGVQNFKLGKGASEVVAIAVVLENQEITFKTATESIRKIKIKDTLVGKRVVAPREVLKMGNNNRITGVVQMNQRWENAPPVTTEEAVVAAAQLALI